MHESYAPSVISLEKSGAFTTYPNTKFIRENHHFPFNQITLLTWFQFSSVIHQAFSLVQLFVKPWNAACQASLSIINSRSLLKPHAHQAGDAIQPSHPLSSPSPAFNLSQHQGFFSMSQYFTSGGQRIGVSASATVLPMNIQGWFPLGWTNLISLQSKGLSRVFSNITVQKHKFFSAQLSL